MSENEQLSSGIIPLLNCLRRKAEATQDSSKTLDSPGSMSESEQLSSGIIPLLNCLRRKAEQFEILDAVPTTKNKQWNNSTA